MSRLFEFLFKYPAFVFHQGDFTFAASRSTMMVIAIVAAAGLGALLTYRGIASDRSLRDRVALVALRVAAVALLVFCLFRPSLILKPADTQQNFWGVLIDDSRSMTIADKDGQPRSQFVQQQLGGPRSPVLDALSQPFGVRFLHLSSSADRLASPAGLTYGGSSTPLGQARDRGGAHVAG